MGKITILGVEVDESLINKIIESGERDNVDFNSRFFSDKVNELQKVVDNLSKAGKDFKKDYIEMKRLYDGLFKINEWFSEYNYTDKYPTDKVTKAKRLVQIKTNIPNYNVIDSKYFVKMDGTGLFAVVEFYIIPFSLVDNSFDRTIDCLRDVSLKTGGRDIYGSFRNPFNLPEDGMYGSSRAINQKLFAVVVQNQESPIAKYLERNISWRYMASDGAAV